MMHFRTRSLARGDRDGDDATWRRNTRTDVQQRHFSALVADDGAPVVLKEGALSAAARAEAFEVDCALARAG